MLAKLWSLVLYVNGLFQSLWPCPSSQLLSLHHLDTQQYVGTWYFIAAVGNRPSDIRQFTSMDSTVFDLQTAKENATLVITGAIRTGDSCLSKVWTYHVDPDKDYLDAEGWPNRRTLLWNGEWLNCAGCVMLQETDLGEIQDETNRIMLYARNGSLSDTVVKDFQSKLSCLGMSEFFSLPQEKGRILRDYPDISAHSSKTTMGAAEVLEFHGPLFCVGFKAQNTAHKSEQLQSDRQGWGIPFLEGHMYAGCRKWSRNSKKDAETLSDSPAKIKGCVK